MGRLFPFGALSAFLTETIHHTEPGKFYGADVHALVISISIKDDSDNFVNPRVHVLCQQAPKFTSWTKGHFKTQVSVFANVIERHGAISLFLFGNRGAGV